MEDELDGALLLDELGLLDEELEELGFEGDGMDGALLDEDELDGDGMDGMLEEELC